MLKRHEVEILLKAGHSRPKWPVWRESPYVRSTVLRKKPQSFMSMTLLSERSDSGRQMRTVYDEFELQAGKSDACAPQSRR